MPKQQLKTSSSLNKRSQYIAIGLILIFALAMTYLILISRAASSNVSLEAETATLNNAKVGSDAKASNGKYIEFIGSTGGGGDTTPPPPASSGYVDPDDVGPRGNVNSYQVINGSVTISNGETLQKVVINGNVHFKNGGTLRDFVVNAPGGRYGIDGTGDVVIEYGTLKGVNHPSNPSDKTGYSAAILEHDMSSLRLYRTNIHGYADVVKVSSNAQIIENVLGPVWKAPIVHADVIQSVGGKNVLITGNILYAQAGNYPGSDNPGQPSGAAVIAAGHWGGSIDNYRVESNLVYGGNYAVTLSRKSDSKGPFDSTIKDNYFRCDTHRYGPYGNFKGGTGPGIIVLSGNVCVDEQGNVTKKLD